MKLAINGGEKLRTQPFPNMSPVSFEGHKRVNEVLRSKCLSAYRGNFGPNFGGGRYVKLLEETFAAKFGVKHAIAINSCTSALFAACGAVGLAPGDEVIVTPWSMSCSATAPLWWNAIPVFADIDEYFCLDPASVEERITERTRAIIVVDLFGQPADYTNLGRIAKTHGLKIIEDAAQAIGSRDYNDMTGTLGDIGCFSFTTGKILSAGEGGMIVTDDDALAMRCRLILNHAEAVINDMINKGKNDGVRFWDYDNELQINNNMLGMNMRMSELHAALLIDQVERLDEIVEQHQMMASVLSNGYDTHPPSKIDVPTIHEIPPITDPGTRPNCTNAYYVQPFLWDASKADGLHRDKFIEAVAAELPREQGRENEGVMGCGYIKPLYLFPLFQEMKLYGGSREPWGSLAPVPYHYAVENYAEGSCPRAERLWRDELFFHRLTGMNLTRDDMADVLAAFWKVWDNRGELS